MKCIILLGLKWIIWTVQLCDRMYLNVDRYRSCVEVTVQLRDWLTCARLHLMTQQRKGRIKDHAMKRTIISNISSENLKRDHSLKCYVICMWDHFCSRSNLKFVEKEMYSRYISFCKIFCTKIVFSFAQKKKQKKNIFLYIFFELRYIWPVQIRKLISYFK